MCSQSFEPVVVPAPNFILGHFEEMTEDTLGYMQQLPAHGDFVRVRMFNKMATYLHHPDLVQDFLIKKSKDFRKPDLIIRAGKDIIKQGLFMSDGDLWKQQRKLMTPAFHSKRIGAYADAMVTYTQQMIDSWSDGQQLDLDAEMMALTMRIITKTMFDMELEDDLHELSDVVEEIFEILNARLTQLVVLPPWVPTPQNRQMAKSRARLHSLMKQAIDQWQAQGEDRGDLLSMLMLATYEDGSHIDEELLYQELITIFAAGHETTAHTLAYTFYLLAEHPEIKAKVQDELQQVLGDATPTLYNVSELTYLDQVIKEAMRILPVTQLIMREATRETDICGVPIEQGEVVSVSTWAIHHDERWFPDSETFDPERFNDVNGKDIPKYGYLPFGAGPRVCIGNQFAMLEIKLTLATILQQIDYGLVDGYQMVPEPAFTTKPAGGVPVVVKRR